MSDGHPDPNMPDIGGKLHYHKKILQNEYITICHLKLSVQICKERTDGKKGGHTPNVEIQVIQQSLTFIFRCKAALAFIPASVSQSCLQI